MEEKEYIDNFEQRLDSLLAGIYGSDGQLMIVDEIEEVWQQGAPEYMVSAVAEINHYPAFTLAVPAYVGMAMALWWDKNWEAYKERTYDDLFKRGGGFDTIDEYILEHVLAIKPDSKEREELEGQVRAMAHTVMSAIQHEDIEHQTTRAFYILARAAKVMFRAGATLWLKRLGYHYEKVKLPTPLAN